MAKIIDKIIEIIRELYVRLEFVSKDIIEIISHSL